MSQHGGRSSTGRETVLPRRQKPYPPCVLSSPRGEVALPSHRARQPHSARQQSSVASSARRRAPSADGAFFFGPPSTSLFVSLGFPAGRPCVILTPRKRLAVLLSFSQAQPLSAETQIPIGPSDRGSTRSFRIGARTRLAQPVATSCLLRPPVATASGDWHCRVQWAAESSDDAPILGD